MINMINEKIVSELERLTKFISHNIDKMDISERQNHIFRLKQISNAIEIIKRYATKIKSGSELKNVKGIGAGIIRRVDEIINNGFLSEITSDVSRESSNQTKDELQTIYGIGNILAQKFAKEYGIHTIIELKKAYQKGIITLNKNVIMGLKYEKIYKQHIPRNEIMSIEKYMYDIAKQIDNQLEIIICGSYRRNKPFSNDIDCMLCHPKIITYEDMLSGRKYLYEYISYMKFDTFILDSLTGDNVKTKFMGFCQYSAELPVRRIDIRYIPYESYYSALLYFTGSGNFNQSMRQKAKKMGFKLNEYGLYKKVGDKYQHISVKSERDIFNKLKMKYVEPSDRDII